MAERDLGSFKEALENMDLEVIASTSIINTTGQIVKLNVDQLRNGLTSEEGRLIKYRNPLYALEKNQLNPLPGLGNPDFILTGAFTSPENFRAELVGDAVRIYSIEEKAPKLEARDGADMIYGLGEERHDLYIEEDLEPEFMEEVKKSLK